MKFFEYRVAETKTEFQDAFILRVKPKSPTAVFSFLPGQYVYLKNPNSQTLEKEHPFSITSSPTNRNYLEFCIKIYGDWAEKLSNVTPGSILKISEPHGTFVWNKKIKYAVFLLGGIGIAPVISMLRFVKDTKQTPHITILYGNRTPETVAYRKELEELEMSLNLRVIDIYSHLEPNHPWQGYRGFITRDVLEKEIDFSKKPVFFVVGPHIFIEKMKHELKKLNVKQNQIKEELLGKK